MGIKKILVAGLLLLSSNGFAQTKVYIAPNGKILSEEVYEKGKITSLANARTNYGAGYQLYEKLELVAETNDSIKYKFKWDFLTKDMLAEKLLLEKLVGSVFKFKDLNFMNKSTAKKINLEKPTFINFWFTNCIPCIEELTALNELKEKYRDNVNFVSITFDDDKKVSYFLTKHNFNFIHIVDEKKLIDSLGISGFPKSFLLDRNQKIQFIEGALPSAENKQSYETQMISLAEKLNKLI